MKNIIFLLLLCSCSTIKDLYDDVMTPEKDERVQPVATVSEKPQPKAEVVPSVQYVDEVSKNWEYQRQMGSFIARNNSLDKSATLILLRDSSVQFIVGLQAMGSKMKYREGHSVEVRIDDQFKNFRVEPTDGDSIKFVNGVEFSQALKGKKTLEVNVLNEKGPQKFIFNISGLQDYFTTI